MSTQGKVKSRRHWVHLIDEQKLRGFTPWIFGVTASCKGNLENSWLCRVQLGDLALILLCGWEFFLGLVRRKRGKRLFDLSFLPSKLWEMLEFACKHSSWSNPSVNFVHICSPPFKPEIYLLCVIFGAILCFFVHGIWLWLLWNFLVQISSKTCVSWWSLNKSFTWALRVWNLLNFPIFLGFLRFSEIADEIAIFWGFSVGVDHSWYGKAVVRIWLLLGLIWLSFNNF